MATKENTIKVNVRIAEKYVGDDIAYFADSYHGQSCYICDSISEWADNQISIYTYDQVKYANDNASSAREALASGLALDGSDYFRSYPNNDYEDYTAHVGVAAWFMDNENVIYQDSEKAAYMMAVYDAAAIDYDGEFSGVNPQAVFDEIDATSWDLRDYDRADDITDEVHDIARGLMDGEDDEDAA